MSNPWYPPYWLLNNGYYYNPVDGTGPYVHGPEGVFNLASAEGSGSTSAITSMTYLSGLLASYVQGGVAYTVTLDANNRIETITGGGVTRTATYNADGTAATWS